MTKDESLIIKQSPATNTIVVKISKNENVSRKWKRGEK